MVLDEHVRRCICCGSHNLVDTSVLWRSLIDEWRLSSYEVGYINRQQGFHCSECHSNLRSMSLAQAIMRVYAFDGLLSEFVECERFVGLKVLECNRAGSLTQFLDRLPGHLLVEYPEVDMMQLPFVDGSFDLVVHSDTLEHVRYPVRALSECRRVLSAEGYCVYTVPMVVDRLTIARYGLPPSYHGAETPSSDDQMVHTEYGSDAWKQVILAGFQECRIYSLEHPAALALICVR